MSSKSKVLLFMWFMCALVGFSNGISGSIGFCFGVIAYMTVEKW